MGAADQPRQVDVGRVVAAVTLVGLVVALAILFTVELTDSPSGGSAAPPPPAAVAPTEEPAAPEEPEEAAGSEEPATTEAPVATEPPPAESPTGDLEPGTTAIFRGEPATGPWQGLGSVSEITADGAGPVAIFGYDRHWKPYGCRTSCGTDWSPR